MIPSKRFDARPWIAGFCGAAIVAAMALAWWYSDALELETIEAWVGSLGLWAPIGYVVLYAVGTVAMVPGSLFDTLGGALFGPVVGSIVNLIGGSIGAFLAFFAARYVAGDWVEERSGPRVREIKRSVEAEGWRFVAMVRLVPVFPYTVFNYLLGLTRISFWQYAVTTVVCMAPSTVVYTWLGHAGRNLVSGEAGDEPIRYALMFLGVAAVVLFLPRLVKRWQSRGDVAESGENGAGTGAVVDSAARGPYEPRQHRTREPL
ncbi:MAG TPA: TVP38/TMEM64 family protein [Pseudolabrys sp.]|nr:TVP38/TMEM64 family protein [Pseudolabrys sp.]